MESVLANWQAGLFALGMALLLYEAATPGLGLASALGFAALLGCFVPELAAGTLPMPVAFLALAACALLLADSLLPGLGPLAILGVACLFTAFALASRSLVQCLGTLAASVLFSVPAVLLGLHRIPESKALRRITLNETLAGNGLDAAPPPEGHEAVALTDLKPGGFARVNGVKTPVLAQNGVFLPKGTYLRVVETRNGVAVVREHTPSNNKGEDA